jgi:hypothetical protein
MCGMSYVTDSVLGEPCRIMSESTSSFLASSVSVNGSSPVVVGNRTLQSASVPEQLDKGAGV